AGDSPAGSARRPSPARSGPNPSGRGGGGGRPRPPRQDALSRCPPGFTRAHKAAAAAVAGTNAQSPCDPGNTDRLRGGGTRMLLLHVPTIVAADAQVPDGASTLFRGRRKHDAQIPWAPIGW